eukprot:scaffold63964_cov40-Prasinocladus_malaysianus.AAC.1
MLCIVWWGRRPRVLAQVECWDYMPDAALQACFEILETHVGRAQEVRYQVDQEGVRQDRANPSVKVSGRIDALTDTALWELKCVDQLKKEHFLQLAAYAWIWNTSPDGRQAHGPRRFQLLNFRTGELHGIADDYGLEAAVGAMLEAKLRPQPTLTDKEFLDKCKEIHKEAKRTASLTLNAGPQRKSSPTGARKLPYKCELCSPIRSFASRKALDKHQLSFHFTELTGLLG